MGRHGRMRLITGNQSLTAANLAESVGNLKIISQRKQKSRNNGQNLSDKSSEIAELGKINGINLGRHGNLGHELTASAGKDGHTGPGEKEKKYLISRQKKLNSAKSTASITAVTVSLALNSPSALVRKGTLALVKNHTKTRINHLVLNF